MRKTDGCSELNDCSGRGRCSFGRCECFQGWTGPDCGRTSSGADGILDSWQLAVVIIGATGMLASLLILCSHLYRLQHREDMEGRDEEYDAPLLLDEVGSVGSVDTSDEEGGEADDDACEGEQESQQQAVAAAPPSRRRQSSHQEGGDAAPESRLQPSNSDAVASQGGDTIQPAEATTEEPTVSPQSRSFFPSPPVVLVFRERLADRKTCLN